MKGWRFSWKAVLGWVAGSLAAGALIGIALDVANILLSPEDKDEFLLDGVVLVFGCGAIFMALTAIPLLLSSIVWRAAKWWPRPWAEMIIVAAICFGLVHAPGVNINFDFDGPQAPWYNGLVFFCVEIVPVLTGLLAPFVYWWIAKPKRV